MYRGLLRNSKSSFHFSFTQNFAGSKYYFSDNSLNKLVLSVKIHGFHYNRTKKINGFRGTSGTRSNEAPWCIHVYSRVPNISAARLFNFETFPTYTLLWNTYTFLKTSLPTWLFDTYMVISYLKTSQVSNKWIYSLRYDCLFPNIFFCLIFV